MKLNSDFKNDLTSDREAKGPASATADGGVRRRIHCNRRGNQLGQSLVEFSIVVPVLLLVMSGLVSFGFALHNDVALTNAVNLGAQSLAFSRGQTADPCATAYSAISGAAPSLTNGLTLNFVINGTSYSAVTSCTAAASDMVQGASAQITASYPCTLAVVGMSFSPCALQSQVTELIQ